MRNEIGQLLEEAFGDVGATPPETAVHARARRQHRSRLLGASGAVAVLLVAGLLAVRDTPTSQVNTNGPASAPSSVEDPSREAGPGEVGATDTRGAADGTKASATSPRVPSVTPTLPSVTMPGQRPPAQHVFTPSPSGTRIYFVADGGGDLVSMRLDGTDRVVVVSGYTGQPIGIWPDGTKLLMSSTQGGSGSSIDVLDLRTGERKTLFQGERFFMMEVALSPDGTRIAYSKNSGRIQTSTTGYTSPHDVHIVNIDGSGDRVLVTGDSPLWAPDGSRLLVRYCGDAGNGKPCTIKPDGSGVQMLDGFPYYGGYSWSPDGEWFAGPGASGRLSIARIDGSQLRTLGKAMYTSERPAWTPDGSRVVYIRVPEGPRDPVSGECGSGCDGVNGIWSAAVDGSGEVQLTTAHDHALVIG